MFHVKPFHEHVAGEPHFSCDTKPVPDIREQIANLEGRVAHVIAICNQKGGVGKTTTAISLSSCLAIHGKRTLLVDADPQGNAGSGLGINKHEVKYSIYHVLIGRSALPGVIVPSELENLHICPSNADLVAAELELVGLVSRETRLKAALSSVSNSYDYVIIDCPPSLGLLTLNAMTAATHIIIPVQVEYYAMEGLADLMRTVQLVRGYLNPGLSVLGVLLTMFDSRNNLSHQVYEELKQHVEVPLFDSIIPRTVRLSEAPSHGKPIVLYDDKSVGSLRYHDLAREVLARFGDGPLLSDVSVAAIPVASAVAPLLINSADDGEEIVHE